MVLLLKFLLLFNLPPTIVYNNITIASFIFIIGRIFFHSDIIRNRIYDKETKQKKNGGKYERKKGKQIRITRVECMRRGGFLL